MEVADSRDYDAGLRRYLAIAAAVTTSRVLGTDAWPSSKTAALAESGAAAPRVQAPVTSTPMRRLYPPASVPCCAAAVAPSQSLDSDVSRAQRG